MIVKSKEQMNKVEFKSLSFGQTFKHCETFYMKLNSGKPMDYIAVILFSGVICNFGADSLVYPVEFVCQEV